MPSKSLISADKFFRRIGHKVLPRVGNTEVFTASGGGGGKVSTALTLPSPCSEHPPPSRLQTGIAAHGELGGPVREMQLPGAKGHGGTGHKTGLPIGWVQGGRVIGPGNASAWHKGAWRNGLGDSLSCDSKFKKEAKISDIYI
jgi:hypothetical protein